MSSAEIWLIASVKRATDVNEGGGQLKGIFSVLKLLFQYSYGQASSD